MKCFKKFRAVFCLVFAFMFIFGNAFLVQAATVESDEAQPLVVTVQDEEKNCYDFYGLIYYNCKDIFTNKKISNIENVVLKLAPYCSDGVSFEQVGFDARILASGKEARGYVYGNLTEKIDDGNGDKVEIKRAVRIKFVFYLPGADLNNVN